jgi:hypothetical protein
LTSFDFLNFYEKSYFWFLKRFYTYNNLQTNTIKNKKHLNFTTTQSLQNPFFFGYNEYLTYFNFLTKTSSMRQSNLSHFCHASLNFSNTLFLANYKNFYVSKDIFLNFDENSLLTTDNLKILY